MEGVDLGGNVADLAVAVQVGDIGRTSASLLEMVVAELVKLQEAT